MVTCAGKHDESRLCRRSCLVRIAPVDFCVFPNKVSRPLPIFVVLTSGEAYLLELFPS